MKEFHGETPKSLNPLEMDERELFKFGFVESYDIIDQEQISPMKLNEVTSIDHLLEYASDFTVRRYHHYDKFNNDLSYMILPSLKD